MKGDLMLYIKESRGDIFKIIGANVRYYRGLYNLNHPDKRISQAKMAHMCNVSSGLIGSLETGKVQGISIPVLFIISICFSYNYFTIFSI